MSRLNRLRTLGGLRGRALSGSVAAAAWTPASLFTTESGDWWLPTPGYVFTDAGTTAATLDGDALYQINGQRGSINLVQSSAALRPTLQLAEVGANPAFRLDGINDLFDTFALTLPNPGELTFFAAIKITSGGGRHIFQVSDGTDPTVEYLNVDGKVYLNGASGLPETSGGTWADAWHTLITRDRNASRQIWQDGSAIATESTAATLPTGSITIQPFRRGNVANNFFASDLACYGFICRYLTDAEMALLSTYLGGLLA